MDFTDVALFPCTYVAATKLGGLLPARLTAMSDRPPEASRVGSRLQSTNCWRSPCHYVLTWISSTSGQSFVAEDHLFPGAGHGTTDLSTEIRRSEADRKPKIKCTRTFAKADETSVASVYPFGRD
jgi:hypothetical protein